GIGRFVRDTPRYPKGSPAISPAPLACILRSLEEACLQERFPGVRVLLSVPGGAETAPRTLNPKIGIEGGISVLGTTGFVEPWDDHLGEAAVSRIAESPDPVLTTGRIGLRYARRMFPESDVVLVGSKIQKSVEAVRRTGTLIGLPGLILKFIRPEILEGTGYQTVEEFSCDPRFPRTMQDTLAGFHEKFPKIRVILIDRAGTIIGETP
ncbi:MAG: cobalt-precorrin-5B (C(1))-methyltransferase, partial [Methanoregulaceae archaeon]